MVRSFVSRGRHGLWGRVGLIVAGMAVGALLFAGCGDDDSGGAAANRTGEDTTRLTAVFPTPSIVGFYTAYVAREQGFFADEGLEVEINTVDGTEPMLQALAAGQADIIEASTSGLFPAIEAQAAFDPIMFYLIQSKSNFDVVVETGSPARSPEDLAGKTIGVATPDGAEAVTAKSLMDSVGLKEGDDYKIQAVGDAGQAVAAISRGDIDAFSGGIAELAVLDARGIDVRSIASDDFQSRNGTGVWTTKDFAESNPDVVRGYARAMTHALEWVGDDPTRVLEVAASINPQETAERDVAQALAEIAIGLRERSAAENLGEVDPEAWQRWYETLVSTGQLEGSSLDASKYYTNDFVE